LSSTYKDLELFEAMDGIKIPNSENELFHEKISILSKKVDFVKDFG